MIWFNVISTTETKTRRGINRGGGITRWPRNARYPRMMIPAILQRSPANTPGETVAIPIFIASQVVPQTKQIKTNIARCGVVELLFIDPVDVLVPIRNASASARVPAAPKQHGPYALQ